MSKIKQIKEYYKEDTNEHFFILECEKCGEQIEVVGCSTCKFRNTNYLNYDEAEKCHECDMFHRNYEFEGE